MTEEKKIIPELIDKYRTRKVRKELEELELLKIELKKEEIKKEIKDMRDRK